MITKYGAMIEDVSKTAEGRPDAVKVATDNARSALERRDDGPAREISLGDMVRRTEVETDRFTRKQA